MKNLVFIILISLFSLSCSSTQRTARSEFSDEIVSECYYGTVIELVPSSSGILKSDGKAFVYADSGIIIVYGDYKQIKRGDHVLIQEKPPVNYKSFSTYAIIGGKMYPVLLKNKLVPWPIKSESFIIPISEDYFGTVIKVASRSSVPSPYKNAFVYADSGVIIVYGDYKQIKEGSHILIQEELQRESSLFSTYALIRGERYPIKK